MTKKLTLTLCILLLLATVLTGCNLNKTQTVSSPANVTGSGPSTPDTTNPSESNSSTTSSSSPANDNTSQVKVTLYFPTPDAMGLKPVERTIKVANHEIIKAIFNELSSPPVNLSNPLPKGTKLLEASVKDGVAVLNLSQEFRKNFGGGSAGEQMTIYSIVNTLTSLSNVHSVLFLLDGQKQDSILGQLDTSQPIKRDESIILK